MTVKLVSDPKTQPPSQDQPYVAVMDEDGNERWLLLSRDDDDVTDADFEFRDGE